MKALVLAALICNPGDRLIDLGGKLPPTVKSIDLLIAVEPYYTRLYVYHPGFPDSIQSCCHGSPTSVVRLAVTDGRFCLRQSRPQMKWKLKVIVRPETAA
ncbi:hypothetical protein [Bradyrhizobium sp.]|uniref:hypothetical protein n=1 Tax=Bradyrhizobium sp. TaxID=376 RepID=UPI00239C1D48|nr:hypothetical protein [Bradyrhizobium sp.]MDE2379870.1 hypothetical protein [Bradyrhizobium sp.]